MPGFCKSATLEDVRRHGHVLTPGRYVGAEAQEIEAEPFEEKMQRLAAQLRKQQAEAAFLRRDFGRQAKLDAATRLRRDFGRQVAANLRELGYGG